MNTLIILLITLIPLAIIICLILYYLYKKNKKYNEDLEQEFMYFDTDLLNNITRTFIFKDEEEKNIEVKEANI
jgi:Ca2+/Na+ antiporter